MARSWLNFFKVTEEELRSSLATETPAEEGVEAGRREPSVAEVSEIAEPAPGEVEYTPDARAGGWFGRLRHGLRRSRESVVGQLNAAVAEFRDADDEEFWERVEEILITSDVGVPTTRKLVERLERDALERNITSGDELRRLMIDHAA